MRFRANTPARLLWLSLLLLLALEAQALEIGGELMPAGQRTDIRIDIPAGPSDPRTFIPLSVLRGSEPGPTLLIIAGVHGYEFASILAAERLAEEIQPESLTGSLVLVRVAHIPAFEDRSPFVNPYDRKNLNRSFPGKPDGTQAERIAYALSTEVIAKADFVADVHSGDGAEWLDAFVGVYGGPLSHKYEQALAFAKAMQFPNIVRYQMMTQEQVDTRRSLNRQAVAAGLPTVLIEIGQNGSRDPAHVEAIVSGIKNAMRGLALLKGEVKDAQDEPRYFDGGQSVRVMHSGVWYPRATRGRFVKEGEVLGEIHDYTGKLVETVRSPIAGYGLYGPAGPPIRKGDSAMSIAVPIDQLD